MRTLTDKMSLDNHWAELVYTRAKLAADPLTTDLAPQAAALIERLMPLRAEQLATWEAEVVAQAEVDTAEEALSALVLDFAHFLEYHLRDTQSPRWRHYFTELPSALRRLTLEPALTATATWSGALSAEPEPELQAFAPRVRAVHAQGATALEHQRQANLARATHRLQQILSFVATHNATRRTLYAALLTRANAHNLPKAWPDRFFRRGA